MDRRPSNQKQTSRGETALAAAYRRALERLKPPTPEERDFESEWALRPADGERKP